MKTAILRRADGNIEKKLFEGTPLTCRFSYKKDERGSIVGRVYFQINKDQDLTASVINYTETVAPERQ